MNFGKATEVATRGFHGGLRVVKRFSPEILTGVGIIGGVTAAVMASRATLKLEDTQDKARQRIDEVKELKHYSEEHEDAIYSDSTYKKDLTVAYIRAGGDFIQLYGPSISLGAASILSILGAHGIMHKRQVALVAAYKAVEESFNAYRKRVIEELGEDKDRDFRLGLRHEEIKDEKTGEVTIVTHVDPNGNSMYARFFDEFNANWSNNAELNLLFLKCQQEYANQRLQTRGYLLLNDVYKSLGMEMTTAGTVVGWKISPDGDNYVDFGIYNANNEQARQFVNGNEKSILLDFNVDGIVNDEIDRLYNRR